MGAGHIAGLAMLASALRLQRWVDVRLAYGSTLILMTGMLSVTLLHFDDAHLLGGELTGFASAWGWLAVRPIAPIVGGTLLLFRSIARNRKIATTREIG